ncbi:MAG: CapA family protein [Chloroflexota bacterium]|nr:CapA family protein [Chloroflexota bacterium]
MTNRHERVLLVGDVMIRGRVPEEYWQMPYPFSEVARHLSERGVVVANLEMPLSTRGVKMPKWSNLRSHPEVIGDIRRAGIDAVSLANNHMLDYGPDALFETLATCDRAGIPRCGAGKDLDESLEPVVLDVGRRQVAVLGVATTLPVGSEARSDRPGIAPIRVSQSFEVEPNLLAEQPGMVPIVRTQVNPEDQAIVCDRVRGLKRDGMVVVVMIHWGVPEHWLSPYTGLLAEYQQPLGRGLIDAGADVVCGHHSHTLHPIELYQGKPIFYSLGNFLFERPRAFMEAASFIVEIDPSREPSIGLTPVLLDEQGFPYLIGADDARRVIERLDALSQPLGTAVSFHEGHGRLRPSDADQEALRPRA